MRERLLGSIARLSLARPYAVLGAGVLLSVAGALLLPRLEVSASRFALIAPSEARERARTEAFERAFGRRADLVAAVTGDPEASRAALDELAARLAELPEADGVLHRVGPEAYRQSEVLFLPLEDLEGLSALGARSGDPRVAAIVEEARRGLAGETTETLDTLEEAPDVGPGALRMLTRTLEELAAWLRDPSRDRVALVAAPPPAYPLDEEGYLVSDDGRTRYLFFTPREVTDRHDYVAPLTRRARAIGAEVAREHGVEVAFTGYPAIAADEIDAIRNGTLVTGLLAAALVMLLFALWFRSVGSILVAGAPLAMGMLWAFGVVALTVGEVNLLTQVAAPVFAGLGIDFAIHLLAAYDRGLRDGATHDEATIEALTSAGKGILTGGLTTATAFGALWLAEYDAFAQLGLTASVGLVLVMLAVLALTPALLTIGARRDWAWLQIGGSERPPLALSRRWVERLTRAASSRPKLSLALGLALTALLLPFAGRIGFDPDVEALMPSDAESIVAGRRMIEGSPFSNEHLGVRVDDEASLRRITARLEAQPSVGRVESAAVWTPDRLEAKLALLEEVRARPPRPAIDDPPPLGPTLGALATEAQGAARELSATSAAAAEPLEDLAEAARDAQRALADAPGGRVAGFDHALAEGAARWRRALEVEPAPIALEDLPVALRRRLADGEGGFAVYAFPRGDVFEEGALERFNREVRDVAPGAVGYPVQFAAFLDRMRASLSRASLLALALVVVLLVADFRRARDAAVALVPVVLGAAWLAGALGLLGVDANLANVAAVPLILGIGVDDGVHLVHRWRERGALRPALRSLWGALVLTTLTTMAGFGTLGLAPHRGMRSFALVMTLGAALCLIATLVVLPALLSLLQGRSDKSSTQPTSGIH